MVVSPAAALLLLLLLVMMMLVLVLAATSAAAATALSTQALGARIIWPGIMAIVPGAPAAIVRAKTPVSTLMSVM